MIQWYRTLLLICLLEHVHLVCINCSCIGMAVVVIKKKLHDREASDQINCSCLIDTAKIREFALEKLLYQVSNFLRKKIVKLSFL